MVGAEIGAVRHDEVEADRSGAAVRRWPEPAAAEPHGTALKDISLELRGGEILASPAWPATGRTSSSPRCRAKRFRPAPRIVIDGTAVGREDINRRRRAGAAFVPEERLGHAAAPRLTLSENALLSGHAPTASCARASSTAAAALGWVDAVTRPSTCARARATRGAGAVGRQPAEIRGRARAAAQARRAGGRAADLGRRCGRRAA
jgi:general nucleoside transport system ATP-binding protein